MDKTTDMAITEAVTNYFIETGLDISASEIAEIMQLSPSAVRRAISTAHGCPKGLQCYQVSRPRYEKNYGQKSGSSRVWVYGPTRDTLRCRLLGELSQKKAS